jgi:transglutaminase-like putative cysteine protease
MNWRPITIVALFACALTPSCGRETRPMSRDGREAVPIVVTEDIQAGIEQHIAEQVRKGNGFMRIPFRDQELKLKLVRIHAEYLANLGPRRHFACVDLVDTAGDVYDVDFFLAGDPGEMTVTETTVHKLNGQPFYAWSQKPDGTWHRIPVEDASETDLGVVRGQDEFQFRYQATLSTIDQPARMWLPLATSDEFQTVDVTSIRAPGTRQTLEDREHGNKILLLELGPQDSGKTVEIVYQVQRREKSARPAKLPDPEKYLRPERLVPINETFRSIAQRVVKDKTTDLRRARALYDHVIDRMQYIKCGTGWGKGDAMHACDARSGNCTDYHAYFIALARAVRIPARFAIGAAIPSERNEGGVSGYHCWAEFYADGKWWPVDISEGDKYTALATYYFGHHPANRIRFSRGRDLTVDPAPASGPINFLAYPLLEVAGKPRPVSVQFTFQRPPPARTRS